MSEKQTPPTLLPLTESSAVSHAKTFQTPRALPDMPRGGIVGVCNVVAFIGPDGFLQGFESPAGWDKAKHVDKRWHIPGSYGLVLADVRPLPFTPFKGALGLFDVPDDIALPLLGGVQ